MNQRKEEKNDDHRKYFMYNLHESMRLGRDQRRDHWIDLMSYQRRDHFDNTCIGISVNKVNEYMKIIGQLIYEKSAYEISNPSMHGTKYIRCMKSVMYK